jgi:hypothetical protein
MVAGTARSMGILVNKWECQRKKNLLIKKLIY